MPDARRKRCIRCGEHTDQVGPISWRGYCVPCGLQSMQSALWQLSEDQGPVARRRMRGYARWLERYADSLPNPTP